jgi:hypothetical protein
MADKESPNAPDDLKNCADEKKLNEIKKANNIKMRFMNGIYLQFKVSEHLI